MKQNLNEEIGRIKSMMGLEEQNLWNKIKNTAQNVGNKIQTGVNQAAQTIANKTQPQQAPQPAGQTLEQVRVEWVKVNGDMSNMKGFGEGVSKDESIALQMAEMNGRMVILKKMGKTNGTISASVGDQKLFRDADGTNHYLVIMEPNN